jgi:hypothetical protein
MNMDHFKLSEQSKRLLEHNQIPIPSYNMFDTPEAVVITQRERITDDLIPVIEYVITVNKEAIRDHTAFWFPAYRYLHLDPEEQTRESLIRNIQYGIAEKFKNHLTNS